MTVSWGRGRKTLEIPFLFVFYLVLLHFLILKYLKLSIHSETAVPVATLYTSQRACIGLCTTEARAPLVHASFPAQSSVLRTGRAQETAVK